MEKLIRDGKVAILVGTPYAWSTYTADPEFFMFDKTLCELKERNASEEEVDTYLESIGRSKSAANWNCVEIEWLPVGTPFSIECDSGDYDPEWIQTSSNWKPTHEA